MSLQNARDKLKYFYSLFILKIKACGGILADLNLNDLSKAVVEANKLISKIGESQIKEDYFNDKVIFNEETEINLVKQKADAIKKSTDNIFKISDYILDSTPGLVGDLANWMTSTAKAPQPTLSLGAVLTMMGVIKGHKVRSDTDIRTNIYALGIADAGSGKEHTIETTEKILAQTNHGDLISSPPASGSAIAPLMNDSGGRSFIAWDEIGDSLETAFRKNSPSYEKNIISELMSIYTKSATSFRSRSKTDKKTNPRITIDQPCLGIWGVTTPAKFYSVIDNSNTTNGFLPRWLIFPISDPDAENRNAKLFDDIPSEFINEIARYGNAPKNVSPKGELDISIKPKIIQFCPTIADLIEDIRDSLKKEKIKERERGLSLDAVWSRGWVHVVKCALIVTDGDIIGETELVWSYSLVNEILKGSCEAFISNVQENESGKIIDKVKKIIKKSPGISYSKLLSRSHLKAYEFKPVLETLIQRNEIKIVEELNKRGEFIPTYYCVKA